LTQIIAEKPKPQDQPKRKKRDVNGWLVLDKPVGMTSTHAVSVVKRLLQPSAPATPARLTRWHPACCPSRSEKRPRRCRSSWTGARSTVSPCVGRGARYRRRRRPRHRDQRGRPTPEAVRALIPRFSGLIEQVPPRFSAVKIGGERAYDLARDGEVVELAARPIEIHHIELVDTPDPDHSVLAAECGKGTYVRALARDMGRALGCFGHVTALRRTAVGRSPSRSPPVWKHCRHGAARR
jgi:tRNA pseudouridine55 synthase